MKIEWEHRWCSLSKAGQHEVAYQSVGGSYFCRCGVTGTAIEQQSDRDSTKGRRRRDEAMRRVDENAEEWWKRACDLAIVEAATRHALLDANRVWQILEEWGVPEPHQRRAMGPRMASAARNGVIEKTGRMTSTDFATAHLAPHNEYRSRIKAVTADSESETR